MALLVTLAVAWTSYANRGSLIEVEFADATGINPGETALRFRDVTVGQVEAVNFTPDLRRVVLKVRVDKEVEKYIDSDASFWIVRPQVTAQGVTRLDTVLTGSFIEGSWDSEIAEAKTHFVGLERPPLIRAGEAGTWITLSMDSASGLNEGAPILYRGVNVGRLENIRLSADESSVIADALVESPHDQRLTTRTVFWDTSGFSLSLGASGLSFNVDSMVSLLQGGIAFETLVSGGQPIEAGHLYAIQPDEAAAHNNIFAADPGSELRLTALVENSVRGLEKGADVQFQGLSVGEVSRLAVRVEDAQDGLSPEVLQEVSIAIAPGRLGLAPDATKEDALAFLQQQVGNGLRARVASTGFLGTSMMIELVEIPDAPAAEIAMDALPYPIIPSVASETTDFTQTAEGLMTRIGELPLEETLKSASEMISGLSALVNSPDTRAIPGSTRQMLDDAQSTLSDVRQMVQELRDTGAADNVGATLASARELTAKLDVAAEKLPDLMDGLRKTSDSIGQVDFAGIGDQTKGIIGDVRAMLGTQDAAELPRNLSDTLKAASGLLNELRDGNAAGSLNNALNAASVAADEIASAARDLPGLIQRLQATAVRADALLSSYGERSDFNNEAINMLREVRRASASVGALARMVERNPRAFIMGR
ncbi:intermembrane transport protein PqiB [Paracoccus sp. (in: a-proteobacteria)]|uniref:PqiB family protein n=1 Tax=Paracoccus sp. TaxID=267 RepID=UPI003A85D2BA